MSLVLSFVVHRYYMQFLVLALLFGFKCIMDHKVYKTQILIYKALEEHPEAEQKLKDKNRIF